MFTETGEFVRNLNKLPVSKVKKVGHNNNSLDVIMPEKRTEILRNEIEALGARGGRAFTVTFTDHYLNKYKEEYLEREVNKTVKKTKGVIDHIFVSEYSEAGRFHLHGVVLCKELKNLGTVRRKMAKYGICKVKMIDNSPKWADYVVKSKIQKV